jgi:hypothetical protein
VKQIQGNDKKEKQIQIQKKKRPNSMPKLALVMISAAFPNAPLSTSTTVASLRPAVAITSPHSAPIT